MIHLSKDYKVTLPPSAWQAGSRDNCSVLLSSADLCIHLSPYYPSSESVPTLLVSRRHMHPGDNRNHRKQRGLSSELLVASCARRLETRPEAGRAAVSHRGIAEVLVTCHGWLPHGESLARVEALSTDGQCILSKEGGEAVPDLSQLPPSPNSSRVAGGERAQELAAHYHLDVGPALEACPRCHLWACVSD